MHRIFTKMEEKNEIKHHQMKGITFLLIGILVGIIFCISFIILERRIVGKKSKSNPFISRVEKEDSTTIPQEKRNIIKQETTIIKDTIYVTDTLLFSEDSLLLMPIEEEEEYSSDDFYFDEAELMADETISEEKILNQRRVKVSYRKDDEALTSTELAETITYFNVEQWQSFIKNKTSYHRINNTLRIKGLDISNISIYYINGNYYLESEKHLYPIVEYPSYHKLSLIDTIQL